MSLRSELILVLAVTIAVGMTAAFLAWRERDEPGGKPLVALLGGQTWWSVTFVLELQASTVAAKQFWFDVGWVGIVLIPVAWFVFALEYTGRDEYLQPKYLVALSIVPALTLVLAMLGDHHDLIYTNVELVRQDGLATFERTPGPWFWVITAYTYLLAFLGSLPLLELITSDTLPFRGQSGALLVGVAAPWIANVLFLVDAVPIPGFDPTPIAFGISGVAYLGAMTRFRLLGTSPAPNRRARRLVFERMRDSAVVVDSHDYVVDMNESAADVLDLTRSDALGKPARDLIPRYEQLPEDGSTDTPVSIRNGAGTKEYDVNVTPVSDFQGRPLGRLVSLHDISEHVRQQQRLEVLNRALRHNLRNQTNVIYGYADLLDQSRVTDEGEEYATLVKDRALDIADLGAKAREILDIFDREHSERKAVRVDELLRTHVETVSEAYPNVDFDVGRLPTEAYVDEVLEPVLWNVVENAAEHNTAAEPFVTIRVAASADRVRVQVTDNGPCIDEQERVVIERGTETALEHGSGLGLWLIYWGTSVAGGEVTFEENDPSGSVVTVEVPRRFPADSSASNVGLAISREVSGRTE